MGALLKKVESLSHLSHFVHTRLENRINLFHTEFRRQERKPLHLEKLSVLQNTEHGISITLANEQISTGKIDWSIISFK